jgi:hypothetical protein
VLKKPGKKDYTDPGVYRPMALTDRCIMTIEYKIHEASPTGALKYGSAGVMEHWRNGALA